MLEADYLCRMQTRVRQYVSGELAPPPIAQTLGFTMVSAAADRAVMRLDADPARHGNPMGTIHGGVLCDIADAAMGMAYASTLEDGESFTTLELKINFLRPVWRTTVEAEAVVVHRGRTVGLVECTVTDARQRVVARASSTCLTLRGDQATGR
jgi:uncharacterized protein (TIGR00369 family)